MEQDKDKLKGPIETEFDDDTTELAAPSITSPGPRGTKRKYASLPDVYARSKATDDMMDPMVMTDATDLKCSNDVIRKSEDSEGIPPGELKLHEQFLGSNHPRVPMVHSEDGLVENVIENAMGPVGGEAGYATHKVQDAAGAATRKLEQAGDHLSGNTDEEQDKTKDVTRDAQDGVEKLGNKATSAGRDLEASTSDASRDAHGEAETLILNILPWIDYKRDQCNWGVFFDCLKFPALFRV